VLTPAALPTVGTVVSNWTTAPARTLPNLNGSAFPRYRQVFERRVQPPRRAAEWTAVPAAERRRRHAD
jgi:hypothetical protein